MSSLTPQHLRELAALCGGVALLVVVALFLNGVHNGILAQSNDTPQTAAVNGGGGGCTGPTWLACQQGILPYARFLTSPAYTACAVNASCGNYGYNNPSVPQCNDMPQSNICNGGEQPSYPSYEQFWSGVFSAHPPGSTAGQTQYAYTYWPGTIPPGQGTGVNHVGSAPSVTPGGQLTLEWSCQPSRVVYKMSHQSGSWQNIGILMNTGTFATSATGGGPGFSTGGALYGAQTVTVPTTAGTYNYTLSCNINTATFGAPYPTMTISVTVAAPPSCANGLNYATYGPSCSCPTGQVQSGSQCVAEATLNTFSASTVTPNYGDPIVIAWQSSFADTSCRLGGGTLGTVTNNNGTLSGGTAVPGTGSTSSGPVTAQTVYSIECSQFYGAQDDFAHAQFTATPTTSTGQLTPNPPTVMLNAQGVGSSYIQWYVANADQCQISGDNIPTQQYLGSACSGWHYPLASYNAAGTYNYQLQWYTPGSGWQSTKAAVTVTALTPPSLSCLPSTVSPPAADTVCNWSAPSTQYTSCVGTGPNFNTHGAVQGSEQISVPNSTTYSVTCTGANGSESASAPVNVQNPGVVSHLTASPSRVKKGSSTTLSWQSVGMAACAVTDESGATVATSPGASIIVTKTATFSLSCQDAASKIYPGGSVTVTLIPVYNEI